MKIYLIQKKNTYDITQIVTKDTWSGSLDQVSRSFVFNVINAPGDPNLKNLPSIAIGNFVKFIDGRMTLFFGMIYTAEKTTDIGDISYTAYDLLYHLTKSTWCRSFKDTTAEAIAEICCKEVGVSIGSIYKTKTKIKKLLIDNETLYDTMLKAYNKVTLKTGTKFLITMSGAKMCVKLKGTVRSNIMLTDTTNITKASVTEDASDIINRVRIYDADGNQTGTVTNGSSVKKYGVFQGTYKEQDGINSNSAAKESYREPSQEITIEAVGDMDCISGYAVYLKDSATGLVGKYWIISDQHNFENGVHTMSLTLSFQNLMSTSEITYSEEDG
jgi:hypothetical protein